MEQIKVGNLYFWPDTIGRWGFTLVGDDVHLILCMSKDWVNVIDTPRTYHFIRRNTTECYPLIEYELLEAIDWIEQSLVLEKINEYRKANLI